MTTAYGRREAHLETPTTENTMRRVYADAGPQRTDPNFSNGDRHLHYVSELVDPGTAARFMAPIEQYGWFDAAAVTRVIATLERRGVRMRIAVGRESSPVLYVATDDPELVKMALNADEVHTVDQTRFREEPAPEGMTLVRFWWD